MSSGKALLGVLAGMAAGAALGLLFAPEKGSNTRKKIMRKGEDLADSMEDLTSSLNDKLEAKFNELVNAFGGKVKTARPKSDFASEIKTESMNQTLAVEKQGVGEFFPLITLIFADKVR